MSVSRRTMAVKDSQYLVVGGICGAQSKAGRPSKCFPKVRKDSWFILANSSFVLLGCLFLSLQRCFSNTSSVFAQAPYSRGDCVFGSSVQTRMKNALQFLSSELRAERR